MRLTPLASGVAQSAFAHLARQPGPAAAAPPAPRAEDDPDKNKKPASEEDDTKKPGAEDDDTKKPGAEDDDKKKPGAEDDDQTDSDAEKEGDDDSDKDDDSNPEARKARGRERGRVRAIMLSEPGKANPVAAAELATGTAMSRKQAIAMLRAIGPAAAPASSSTTEPKRDALRDRMNAVENPKVGGGDAAPAPAAGLAQQIVAAGKKRRGEA